MSGKKRGLGRGLGALIPTSPQDEEAKGSAVAILARPEEDDALSADSQNHAQVPSTFEDTEEKTRPKEPDHKGVAASRAPDENAISHPASGSALPLDGLVTHPEDVSRETPDVVHTGNSPGLSFAFTNAKVTSHSTNTDRAPGRPSAENWDSALASSRRNSGGDATSARTALDTTFFSADEAQESSVLQDPDNVSRETNDLLPVPGARFAELKTSSIRPNARQPRTVFDDEELGELVESIREIGVLQPVVVREDKDEPGQYELIMGERRWRATQSAGLTTIPAIIRETDDSDMLRDALLENLHRAALNPLEEAAAYRQLLDDFGCTHEELATRIARSRPQISNTLRLLRLPALVQRRVAAGVLSAGHARALLGLTDGAEIERVAQRVVSEGLSVRATEEAVMMAGGVRKPASRKTPRTGTGAVTVDDLATRLSDRFETRVKVALGKNKGRVTIEFSDVNDLNRILEVMSPEDPGVLKE